MFDVWSGSNLLPVVSRQKLSPVLVIVGLIKEIIINLPDTFWKRDENLA